ncbi:AAA family ATPase [Streptomyces sp. NPDC048275]|uniref:helix-turn-helix transcriptional regulator n=1 Tax=Streptomyces sp. NPDC048275 TaxID=3155629 RepID=UPI0033CFCB3D
MSESGGTPFVGRGGERAALRERLVRVGRGDPQLVLVAGEAGIGKTALVRDFVQDGGGCGTVLWASGEENEQSLTYGVLDQLLGDGQRDGDPLAAGAVLLDALGHHQEGSPVVTVVVDDAHWADTPSLHALTFTLRRLRVDRVLAVVVVREEADPRLPDGLRRLFGDDRTLRLLLDGLAPAQIRDLSGALGSGPMAERTASRLHAHTGGNPLHLRALLRQFPAEVLASWAPLPVPRGHELLVGGLLEGCGAQARGLVEAGSVLGPVFSVHDAAQVAGRVRPEAALHEAVRAGLLTERTVGGNPQAGFAHPLLRAAVYQRLGPRLRAALHRRAAGQVSGRAAVLHHRACAATGPDRELTDELAVFAGELSRRGAWAAASEQLRTAARLSPGIADRERRLLECAECLLLAGDVAQAQAMEEELRELSRTATQSYVLGRLALVAGRQQEATRLLSAAWYRRAPDDPPQIAARAAEQLAWLSLVQGDGREAVVWARRGAGTGTAGGRDALALGLGLSGRPAEGLRCTAAAHRGDGLDGLLAHGVLLMWSGALGAARRELDAAREAHLRGGLPGLGLLALAFLAEAEFRAGDWDASLAHADQAVSLAADTDQRWLLVLVHAMAAGPLAGRGEERAALEHATAAGEHAALLGDASDAAYAAIALAQVRQAAGDHEGVVAALSPLAAPGVRYRDSVDEPGVFPWPGMLAEALARTGRVAEAAPLLAAHEKLAVSRGHVPVLAALARVRGTVETVRGDSAAAGRAYATAVELLTGAAEGRSAGGDSAAGAGDVAGGDDPSLGMDDVPSGRDFTSPTADGSSGGDFAPAIGASNGGAFWETAHAHWAYGVWLRRMGRRAAAVRQLEAARVLFAGMGAVPYLARCEAELAACGKRVEGSSGQRSAAGLTPQELAAARLAAAGLTNRLIARELLLSTKTVEYHLSHAYVKLGIASRVGLAGALALGADGGDAAQRRKSS